MWADFKNSRDMRLEQGSEDATGSYSPSHGGHSACDWSRGQ